MSHIFISYSHQNSTYAFQLADDLKRNGFAVWIDERIDYGDRWFKDITDAIKACAAFTVIMTPAAETSEFVEKEILIAQKYEKPIVPLLAEGHGFDLLITTQYVDVRDYQLPPQKYYDFLRTRIQPDSPQTQSAPSDFMAKLLASSPEQIHELTHELFASARHSSGVVSEYSESTPGHRDKKNEVVRALRDMFDFHSIAPKTSVTRTIGIVTTRVRYRPWTPGSGEVLESFVTFHSSPALEPLVLRLIDAHHWYPSIGDRAPADGAESRTLHQMWDLPVDAATLNTIAISLVTANLYAGLPAGNIEITGVMNSSE